LAALNTNGVVENYEYDGTGNVKFFNSSFSQIASSAINNISTFTGRPFLDLQNQYDFRARVYNNTNGRFLQRDPLGYKDGFNFYSAYFIPNLTDPFGTNGGKSLLLFKIEARKGDF